MYPTRNRWLKRAIPAAVGLLAGTAPAWSQQTALPLSELISRSGNALTVLEADAATDAARNDVDRERSESGLHFTLGGSYGLVRNIISTNQAYTYSAAQLTGGFSLPLLGAAELSSRRVDAALGKQHESEIRADDARHIAQLEIENNYALYWGAQESLKVVQAYLDSEDLLMPKLQLRSQHQLLLPSDQLDTGAGYEQAKSDRIQFERIASDARSRLQRLTGLDLGNFAAVPVQPPPAPAIDVQQLVQHHPDIAALKAQRDALQAQLNHSTFYGFEGSLDVLGTGVQDVSQGGPNGGTAFVGLTIKAPINFIGAASAEHKRLRAAMEELRLKIQDRSEELGGELRAAQQQLAQAQQDNTQISRRVQASSEGLRESYLRGNVFAEEGVGTMSRRLQTYYKTALQDIDTQVKSWQANILLRGYAIAEAADASARGDGPTVTADIGAQLSDPIVQVDEMLGGGASRPAAAAAPAAPGAAAAPAMPPPDAPAQPGPMTQPDTERDTTPQTSSSIAPPDRMAAAPAAAPPAHPVLASVVVAASDSGAQLQSAVYRVPVTAPAVMSDAPAPAGEAEASPQATPHLLLASALSSTIDAAPAPTARPGLAVYVWNSAGVMSDLHSDKFWQGLQAIPVNRLLLALNAQQIGAAQAQPQALHEFIDTARQHGVAVELLLGEPSWIEPAQRPKLVGIINSLRGFDFAGLNLDIEPDQLYKQPIDQAQYNAWMDTLRAAAEVSPWPTAVSIHPRYFRDPPYMSWNTPQRLRQAGVSEAVLMIYSSNPQKVADIAKPIVANSGGLRFRVAQSVEPELEPQLSYAHRSPQDFSRSMEQLQALLAAQPNTDGVVVQAWNDLMSMGYENQIR